MPAAVQENKKRQKLQCSHYGAEQVPAGRPLPIVVYCHCNSGSRRDAEEALYVLLPQGISVFCLDFAVSPASCTAVVPDLMHYQQRQAYLMRVCRLNCPITRILMLIDVFMYQLLITSTGCRPTVVLAASGP